MNKRYFIKSGTPAIALCADKINEDLSNLNKFNTVFLYTSKNFEFADEHFLRSDFVKKSLACRIKSQPTAFQDCFDNKILKLFVHEMNTETWFLIVPDKFVIMRFINFKT